jgi:hypothetical protein
MKVREQNRCLASVTFLSLFLLLGSASTVAGEDAGRDFRAQAFQYAYNLDHEEAMALLDRAVASDPLSASTHRSVAAITWLDILFRRGTITVDDYLGQIAKPRVDLEKPPPALARRFHEHAARAVALADEQLRANPRDPVAHYELGTAVGLLASYTASVEGRILGAFRTARRAYQAHESVLSLEPHRKDAGVIVGLYRYVVASRSLPVRWIAYLAGFGGGKERGLAMIEEAASYPGESQTEARFALVLLYNREKRYDEALRVIGDLQRAFPRNRLLWLEEGATALRAGNPARAEAALNTGIEGLRDDPRRRAFGEEALWMYKRAAARIALKRPEEARRDLQAALAAESHEWVRGRMHIERGKLADLEGDRSRARQAYEEAIRMCEAGNDRIGAAEARRLRADGYSQGGAT